MRYDVLRIVEMIPDRLEQGSPIFRDNNGEIIFISNDEVDVDKSIFEVGKKYLVWIVKDLNKQSYARLTIDGVLLSDFISYKINTLSLHDLYDIAESKPLLDCIMLSNDMYNHDIGFSKSQVIVESTHEDEYRLIKELEGMNINSELSEFVYELGILFVYVHHVYEKIILKEMQQHVIEV